MKFFIFVPAEKIAEANLLAAQLDHDTGGIFTFGSNLFSPTGEEPATWAACSTILLPEMVKTAREAVEAIGGRMYDDILLQHLLYVEKINQEITTVEDEVITPSFESALELMGLKRISPTEE
jgi:hypothetical protein